jgi:hypothetical protein
MPSNLGLQPTARGEILAPAPPLMLSVRQRTETGCEREVESPIFRCALYRFGIDLLWQR